MHRNIVVRLVAYYLVVFSCLSALFYAFPVLGDYVAAERAHQGGRAALELERSGATVPVVPEAVGPTQLLDPERTVPVLLSLLLAPLIALPVVWVYRWTRPPRRYNQTFAQMLIVVPIAITLVVFLVKGSLALAFSLAGIVAAVRFRTTLDEPLDAVYLFLVIGTGLAAGVQLLFVAFIASMVFNAVALAVWRLNLGRQPAVLDGWRLVPAGMAAQASGVGALVSDVGGGRGPAPDSVEVPVDPYNARLRLHVTEVDEARSFASAILDKSTKKWQVAEVAPGGDGAFVIEFDLRLKKSVDLAAFVKELEQGGPNVCRVELTRMKSKKHDSA
jgi:hypothetical protein